MKFLCFFVALAAMVGMSHCFGAGMKQLMQQSGVGGGFGQGMQGFGGQQQGFAGIGGGFGAGQSKNLAASQIGQGQTARTLKGFYSHAFDENGYARMPTMTPQAMQQLAGGMGGGMNGMGGGFGMNGFQGRR